MRRLTRRQPLSLVHDDLPDRLDALEKALRNEVSPKDVKPNRHAIYYLSFHGQGSSCTPSRLSLSSRSALPCPNTMQESVLSRESFYSQTGSSFVVTSRPLPIIQIQQHNSPLSFSPSFNISHPGTFPPVMPSSPQEKRYGQLEVRSPQTPPFILPEQRHPSLSSMLESFCISEDSEPIQVVESDTSIRLSPPQDLGPSRKPTTNATAFSLIPSRFLRKQSIREQPGNAGLFFTFNFVTSNI